MSATGPAIDWVVESPIDEAWLEPLAAAVLATLRHAAAAAAATITIMLADDDTLRRLHREFLGDDSATDVLSFPATGGAPGGAAYLGDVAISVERAVAQAAAAGHEPLAELQLLLIHAVLHLLGHDHALPAEKTAMWREQAALLAELGVRVRLPE